MQVLFTLFKEKTPCVVLFLPEMLLFQPRVPPTHTWTLVFTVTNYEMWCKIINAYMQTHASIVTLAQLIDINANKPLYLS